MKTIYQMTLGLALSAAVVSASTNTVFAGSKAHAHMGHVSKSWSDTPSKKGLLPTAIVEAKIAAFHANAAAKKLKDLKWMQLHTHHVLHAVDASLEAKGPGKGYGVVKAAKGTAFHIKVAAKQADASDNVKTHALHVATSAQNTVDRAMQIIGIGKQILAAKTAKEAAPLVGKMAIVANQLEKGHDADGNGEISWEKGEGGLAVSKVHMGVMYELEGLK